MSTSFMNMISIPEALFAMLRIIDTISVKNIAVFINNIHHLSIEDMKFQPFVISKIKTIAAVDA